MWFLLKFILFFFVVSLGVLAAIALVFFLRDLLLSLRYALSTRTIVLPETTKEEEHELSQLRQLDYVSHQANETIQKLQNKYPLRPFDKELDMRKLAFQYKSRSGYKLPPAEERQLRESIWAEFFRTGLSPAKLFALDTLQSGATSFFSFRRWWSYWFQGWCRIARETTGSTQIEAKRIVKKVAEQQRSWLSWNDLQNVLPFYEESERANVEYQWATIVLKTWLNRGKAKEILIRLADRSDQLGVNAITTLANDSLNKHNLTECILYFKRLLAHPLKPNPYNLKYSIQQAITPQVQRTYHFGTRRVVVLARTKQASYTLAPLQIDGILPEQWLAAPQSQQPSAPTGAITLTKSVTLLPIPFTTKSLGFYRSPQQSGAFEFTLNLEPTVFSQWKELFSETPQPSLSEKHRFQNRSLDGIITLTESSAVVWVVDKKTKRPVADIPVTFSSKETLTAQPISRQVVTDKSGLAQLHDLKYWQIGALVSRPAELSSREFMFLTHNEEISSESRRDKLYRFYFFLARPLYRPGETVKGEVIVRMVESSKPHRRVDSCPEITVLVRNPRWNTVADLRLRLNRFGTASFSFTLPPDAILGEYKFDSGNLHPHVIEGKFRIEEFVAPEFRTTLSTKDQPHWGQPVTIVVDASYFFGGPVSDAECLLNISQSYRTFGPYSSLYPLSYRTLKTVSRPTLRAKTNSQGKAEITIPWQSLFSIFSRVDCTSLNIKLTLRDASGKSCEEQLTVDIYRHALHLLVNTNETVVTPNATLPLSLNWENHGSDSTQQQNVHITLSRGLFRKKRYTLQASPSLQSANLPTDLTPGIWQLTAHLEGQPTYQYPVRVYVVGKGVQAESYHQIVVSKPNAKVGEIVRVALLGPKPKKDLSVFGFHTQSSRLVSDTTTWEKNGIVWKEIKIHPSDGPSIHVQYWTFLENGQFRAASHVVRVTATEDTMDHPPLGFSLSLPPHSRPGDNSVLTMVNLSDSRQPVHVVCTVFDQAILSIVPLGANPVSFFNSPLAPALRKTPWSVAADAAIYGRPAYPPSPYPGSEGGPHEEMPKGDLRASIDSETLAGGALLMDGPPLQAVMMAPAAPMAAPQSRGGFSIPLPSFAPRAKSAGRLEREQAAPAEPPKPIVARSNFSSEAAFFSELTFEPGQQKALPIRFPDSLTTWKAFAFAISLDDQICTAETSTKTQKELMVRLQSPRFFQERDAFSLIALIDSQSEELQSVTSQLEAPGLRFTTTHTQQFELAPRTQKKVSTQVVVTSHSTDTITVRAEVRSNTDPELTDGEERVVPFVPYGIVQTVTLHGVLDKSQTTVFLDVPSERAKEHTSLLVTIDRGPFDAILSALHYLKEYPYGCVEQTCSRLLPHLVLEASMKRSQHSNPLFVPHSEQFIKQHLQLLSSMQNQDGGYGWWARCSNDQWMTAYVVFCFAMANRDTDYHVTRAVDYLKTTLLSIRNTDDCDAFAAFALCFAGHPIDDRSIEVLLSRWDNLSLTQRSQLCWVLQKQQHHTSEEHLTIVLGTMIPAAKRFLSQIAKGKSTDSIWFKPASTEAIAFTVLTLLIDHESLTTEQQDHLEVLVDFLLQHRNGKHWYSTRDTALAVFALLKYREFLTDKPAGQLKLFVNSTEQASFELQNFSGPALQTELTDQALMDGKNTLEFQTEKLDHTPTASHRHYSVELRYFNQQKHIPSLLQGLVIRRRYNLLDDKGNVTKQLDTEDSVNIGQRIRVELTISAEKNRTYILLEDPKFAGCEPLAKVSGPEVCKGSCAHVELRTDRVAIFLVAVNDKPHTLTYDIEAQIPGTFTAMPATAQTMYESDCSGNSESFVLRVT